MIENIWSRLDPGFLAPIWLLVGFLAVGAVILLEIGAQRRRSQSVRQFAALHLIATLTASVSPVKRILKRILIVAAVGLLFIAMARPHLFNDWIEESRTGLDILLAVDCSRSMLTEDVKPSRLERAKLAVADFAAHLPDNRLGLIAFAGDSFLQCPLTLDHGAFDASVRELDTDTIPRGGTDIASAINQAIEATRTQPNNLKILILVTDGEDLEGRDIDAARDAQKAGLKIYTVGVGTSDGGLIPERDGSGAVMYHHNASGEIVQSKLDESSLRRIADITGGAYLPLGQRGEGLEEIYSRYIEPLPKHEFEERREKVPIERFEWPLALAILFLMWEFMVSERAYVPIPAPIAGTPPRNFVHRRKKKPEAALASVLAVSLALAGSAHASVADKAEHDYKSGKYQEALQNYRQATTTAPNRNDLQYNRGDAAYKAGEFTEAEEAFRKTLDTPNLRLQENAYYNLGNTQYKHGDAVLKADTKKTIGLWEQALKSYDSALKLNHSADAKYNYDLVKKRLDELKQQQQQKDQQKNQQQKQQGKQNQDGDQSKQDQSQGQGNQQQNQDGQGNQDPNKQGQQNQQGNQGDKDQQSKDQDGQQSSSSDKKGDQKQYYSQGRDQDKQDPGVKSRQEAKDLLDSLKDDEKHVTARSLNGNEQPPPPSGKDW